MRGAGSGAGDGRPRTLLAVFGTEWDQQTASAGLSGEVVVVVADLVRNPVLVEQQPERHEMRGVLCSERTVDRTEPLGREVPALSYVPCSSGAERVGVRNLGAEPAP